MDQCSIPARLHIEQYGRGTPLVLAHGFAGSARNFRHQARVQSQTHHVWLYDARGHARSESHIDEQAYRWECLISDLDRVVRVALAESTCPSPRRVVVGGLSLGAATALLWALEHPAEVQGLVLAAYPESSEKMRHWAIGFARQIELHGVDIAGYECIWGPHGRFGTNDSQLVRKGFLEHSAAALVGVLRQAMAKLPDILACRRALELFPAPTLVIVGAHDSSSMAASRLIVDAMPGARLAIIEDAGHVVNLSQPRAFNDELAQFVSTI